MRPLCGMAPLCADRRPAKPAPRVSARTHPGGRTGSSRRRQLARPRRPGCRGPLLQFRVFCPPGAAQFTLRRSPHVHSILRALGLTETNSGTYLSATASGPRPTTPACWNHQPEQPRGHRPRARSARQPITRPSSSARRRPFRVAHHAGAQARRAIRLCGERALRRQGRPGVAGRWRWARSSRGRRRSGGGDERRRLRGGCR